MGIRALSTTAVREALFQRSTQVKHSLRVLPEQRASDAWDGASISPGDSMGQGSSLIR